MRSLIAALGIAILCAGCGTAPLNPVAFKATTKLTGITPIPVRAAPEVLAHTDDFAAGGMKFRNETGKSFIIVFAGTKPEMPLIEIASATLTAGFANLGFACDYTYSVTVRLKRGETSRELTAKSSYRSTGFEGPGSAAKIVTENAIADLAEQVRKEL